MQLNSTQLNYKPLRLSPCFGHGGAPSDDGSRPPTEQKPKTPDTAPAPNSPTPPNPPKRN